MIEELLTGNSLGERHRHLNKLISMVQPEQLTDQFVAEHLQKNQLDLVFLAKLASRFRNSALVCELLKSDDTLVIAKALKNDWFFEGINNRDVINADNLINNIFPHMSYRSRCKMITKLANHLKVPTVAEELYTNLKKRYGQEKALKLLNACSEEFIRNELPNLNMQLPLRQMSQLYKKTPLLAVQHIENCLAACVSKNYTHYANPSTREFEPIFVMIARDYPEVFVKMLKSYHEYILNFNWGYKTTCIVVKGNEEFIIENAQKMHTRLHMKAVYDNLSREQFDRFIMKLFPEKWDDFSLDIIKELKFWKTDYVLNYIGNLFKQMYNRNIIEIGYFQHEYIVLLPKDVRIEWAKNMIINGKTKGKNEETYLKYLSCPEAIKRYKELSQSASTVQERTTLLRLMIDTCAINNDTQALLELMLFAAKRYRNDNIELRFGFVEELNKMFTLYELSSNHWKVIDEMFQIMYINKEIDYYRSFTHNQIMKHKLHFYLKNNLDPEPIIDLLIKHDLDDLNMLQDQPELEKKILDMFFVKYKSLIEGKPLDTSIERRIVHLLNAYASWNKRHTNKLHITECDWLVNQLKEYFQEEKILSYSMIITKLFEDEKARMMFREQIFKNNYDEKRTDFYVKNDINFATKNIDDLIKASVVRSSFKFNFMLYQKVKTYMENTLGKMLKEKIMGKINSIPKNSSDNSNDTFIVALSFLIDTDEYENILKMYTPKSTKIDPTDGDSAQVEYRRTETLVENFKYLNPPATFDTLRQYAKDDYLKCVLTSLLSTCFKRNENETLRFVESLQSSPVSLKKHSIRLAYSLFPKHLIVPFYEKTWNNNNNSSIRDVIFERTFYLVVSKTNIEVAKVAFESMVRYMQSFTENDNNLYQYLARVNQINSIFVADYAEASWNTLKKLEHKNSEAPVYMENLIDSLPPKIDNLRPEFCDVIVKEYMHYYDDKDNTSLSDALLRFCIGYMTTSSTVEMQQKRTKEVCEIFKPFIVEKWNDAVNDYNGRKAVGKLISDCCNRIMSKEQSEPKLVLTALKGLLDSTVPFGAAHDLHIYIELTVEVINAKIAASLPDLEHVNEVFLRQFVESISKMIKNHVQSYGVEFLPLFLDVFDEFFDELNGLSEGNMRYDFIYTLLNCDSSKDAMHFAILLLPKTAEKKYLATYQKIISKIVNGADLTLKMILSKRTHVPSTIFINS